MNLKKNLLTLNNCYKAGAKHAVKGIFVHSTGANNPNLKRYVQPDDGLLGSNPNGNHWNQPKPDGKEVCVHAFIGKLANGSVATYQTLPWDIRGWHSGSGTKGNAGRMGYIGFEICEDGLTDRTYFNAVYKEAVELCTMLCKQFNLNPTTDIICHSEAHRMGLASNHADVMHWFPRHSKSMDTFRSDVAVALKPVIITKPEVKVMNNVKLDNTPDAYAKVAVDKAVKKGIIKGDEKGDLKLHSPISRQDVLVMLGRIGML